MNLRIYQAVKSGKSDNSIRFSAFQSLVVDLGFTFLGQEGSHITYFHYAVKEFMNIQPSKGKAKGYQVRQLRAIINKHNL